jgi:hypothetical protein
MAALEAFRDNMVKKLVGSKSQNFNFLCVLISEKVDGENPIGAV